MTEFEYYWEKAEFQDPVSHRAHVDRIHAYVVKED